MTAESQLTKQSGPTTTSQVAWCLSHLIINTAWCRQRIQPPAFWSGVWEEQCNRKERIIIQHFRGAMEDRPVWQWVEIGGEGGGPGLYFLGAGVVVPCWCVHIGKAAEKEPLIWQNTLSEPCDCLSCDTLNSVWISVFPYSLPHLDTEILMGCSLTKSHWLSR